MDRFTFTKMHGLGNNYIYVDHFLEELPEDQLSSIAIAVSNPFTGIGSDGLILIGPSQVADVKMRIFNNDGSEAKNCGNGLRCVAKFAYEKCIVAANTLSIETLGGIVEATVHPTDEEETFVTINMGEPRLKRSDLPMQGNPDQFVINEKLQLEVPDMNDREWSMTGVSMGNPHAVFFEKDIVQAPVHTFGPFLEKHQLFPEGVNVEFVEILSKDEMHFRVWERGSGVTQACGTGACAAVVASILNEKAERDKDITVHLAGGDLIVNWSKQGDVFMTGPAVTICEGTYYYK